MEEGSVQHNNNVFEQKGYEMGGEKKDVFKRRVNLVYKE